MRLFDRLGISIHYGLLWADQKWCITERGRVSNKGERLVIRSWKSAKTTIDAIPHVQRYEWVLPLVKGCGTLLDDGCGTGYGTSYLRREGNIGLVVGMDYSKVAMGFAKKHYGKDGIRFVVGDSRSLPFGEEVFDAVVSFDVLEHIPVGGKAQFVAETARVLKRGGTLYMGCPNGPVPGRYNPFHYDVTKEEFEGVCNRYYGNVEFLGQSLVIGRWKAPRNWYDHLPAKYSLSDFAVTEISEDVLGLLAICKEPRR